MKVASPLEQAGTLLHCIVQNYVQVVMQKAIPD